MRNSLHCNLSPLSQEWQNKNMVRLGKYQHSKSGKFYEVIGVAKHSESLEKMVVVWVRPIKMFLEKIILDGKKVPRFKFISKRDSLWDLPKLAEIPDKPMGLSEEDKVIYGV